MLQDLHYGWRQLRKTPVFTLAAVLSLGLGVGAAVTMFSAFRAVFLRPLPYRDAAQVVEIERHSLPGDTSGTTVADLQFLRRYAHSFDATAGFSGFEFVTLQRVAEPANLWVFSVSRELFPLLGSKPLLGRTLAASDFRSNSAPTVVLSYDSWQKYLHGDPRIIGRQIFLSAEYPVGANQSTTVVGVMPKEFSFPRPGIMAWLPDRTSVTDARQTGVSIVARMRPGVLIDQARSELQRLAPALARTYPPSERHWTLSLTGIGERSIDEYRNAFSLLLAAAGFLVLICCLNVANLLLARASGRAGEFAIRGALGANRWRLIGQVLTESVGLAGLGGLLGLCLAYLGNRLLLWLMPAYLKIPRLEETRLDLAVLGFALLLTFLVGLLFGLAPALSLSSKGLAAANR
ncbi:MAG TPA: ABC transporter permease, partial [Bryobacteraceae bacterium]|nr:ABC transporter permease [Bryobacteraceae bacterium]